MRFIIPPIYLRLLLLLCIYTSTLSLHSQEQEIDSLAKYSYKKLDMLYKQSYYEDLERAKAYATKLFENAQENGNQKELFEAYKRYAVLKNRAGSREKAHEYIDIAKKIAVEKLKDKNSEALSTFLKGKFFYDYGKYEEAFDNYSIAYRLYKDSNSTMIFKVSHNIALVENILGDQEAALKILLKNFKYYNSLSEKERNSNTYSYLNTLLALTDTYIKYATENIGLKDSLLDSARQYNEIGLKESLYTDTDLYSSFLALKGIISFAKGNYRKAISELRSLEKKAAEEKDKSLLTSIYYYTGVSYEKLGQEEKTIEFLKKTDSVSKKNVANYILLDRTYFTLTDLYSKKSDSENTSKYWQLYKENRKINEHVSKSVKSAIRDHDIERLEEQILKLISDKKEKENNYTIALMIIVVLIFLFLITLAYNNRRQRKNKVKFQTLLKELAVKKENTSVSQKKPKTTLTIDEEKVQEILAALDKFEQKKQFIDVNCNLGFVAKKVKTNKAYLSKVIHSEKQQKFIQYITNLRINYALEKLKEDKLFRSYDIKSIAAELGFKSPDSFSRAFKNKTGIYPSYYIKNINKINTSEEN